MCAVVVAKTRGCGGGSRIPAYHRHNDDGQIDPHHIQVDEAEPRHHRQSQPCGHPA